jgi:hypothetical protein
MPLRGVAFLTEDAIFQKLGVETAKRLAPAALTVKMSWQRKAEAVGTISPNEIGDKFPRLVAAGQVCEPPLDSGLSGTKYGIRDGG